MHVHYLTIYLPCHSCNNMHPFVCAKQHTGLFLTLLCVYPSLHLLIMVTSQQDYPSGDYSKDCSRHYAQNAGYQCEPSLPTCDTLAYFRAQPGEFSSLSAIAEQLFNTTTSTIAQASSLSTLSPGLKPGEGLYVPLTCACNGTNFSSHSITYTIIPGDTFVKLANSTFEGLTTCQAIQDSNPHLIPSEIRVGKKLTFPLRCACPSPAQTLRGITFLVTYPIGSIPETISSVVDMFRLNRTEFLLANRIINTSATLFAATTVLLPFKDKPNLPPNASSTPPFSSTRQNSIMIHIAAASATPVILILIIVAAVFYTQKFKKMRAYNRKTFLQPNAIASPSVLPWENKKPPIDLFQVMSELALHEKLIVLNLDDISQATQGFNVSSRIKGAVYRGTIEGQSIAVKKVERDATQEVQILQRLHHSNIISLLGVCIPSPYHSYLVYEYAEGGSLHDWLHGHALSMGLAKSFKVLEWQERLQIAFDVSLAMEYIHEHTNPRYVHNRITSSNILLDSKRRGKLANFSLATGIHENADLHAMHRINIGLPTSLQHVGMEDFSSHEYVKGVRVSPKVDVHAFGIVLLEMLFEKEDADGNVDAIRALLKGHDVQERLRAWMYPGFDYDAHKDCARGLIMLAHSCVAPDPSARPTARTAAFTLSKLRNACSSDPQSFEMPDSDT